MAYKPRLTAPEKGNKYYIRKANGGYSSAILGKVKTTGKPDPNCNVLANCVGYAYGRFNEIGGYGSCKYLSPVNAENFPEYAKGLQTGSTPRLGSVIVWKKGGTLKGDDGAGHVAIVERILSDTQILISQSGYNSKVFWTEIVNKGSNGQWRPSWMGSSYTFRCFIYNPAVTEAESVITLMNGSKGDLVKKLQKDLNTIGNYNLELDGSFGPKCETAVKDFQKKQGLAVDGIAGPATQAAIEKAITDMKKPDGVIDLSFILDNKQVTCWAINIDGHNYVRMDQLDDLGIVKQVSYNSTKRMPEVKS